MALLRDAGGESVAPAPRVLLVMPDQWPRALIRGALREIGYDAIGTRTLDAAMRFARSEPGRGPVRLVVVDQGALGGDGASALARLLARHGEPDTILVAHATSAPPPGRWPRVLRRPVSADDVVTAVRAVLPLDPRASRRLE